jgi:hypothetical protein
MPETEETEPLPTPYKVPQTFRILPSPGVPTRTLVELTPNGLRNPMATWNETIRRVDAGLRGLFHPEKP